MEDTDRELILSKCDSDMQLKRLWAEHMELEQILSRYEGMGFLTPDEEMKVKHFKKKKLHGVDQMMQLVSAYRGTN